MLFSGNAGDLIASVLQPCGGDEVSECAWWELILDLGQCRTKGRQRASCGRLVVLSCRFSRRQMQQLASGTGWNNCMCDLRPCGHCTE
jgi:hypothetical protein